MVKNLNFKNLIGFCVAPSQISQVCQKQKMVPATNFGAPYQKKTGAQKTSNSCWPILILAEWNPPRSQVPQTSGWEEMCKKFFHHVKIMDFGRFFWRIWWRHSKHDELWQNFLPPKETSDPLQQSFKRKTKFEKQWLLAPASKTEWFNFWTISLGVWTVSRRTVLQRLFPDGQISKGQFPE